MTSSGSPPVEFLLLLFFGRFAINMRAQRVANADALPWAGALQRGTINWLFTEIKCFYS